MSLSVHTGALFEILMGPPKRVCIVCRLCVCVFDCAWMSCGLIPRGLPKCWGIRVLYQVSEQSGGGDFLAMSRLCRGMASHVSLPVRLSLTFLTFLTFSAHIDFHGCFSSYKKKRLSWVQCCIWVQVSSCINFSSEITTCDSSFRAQSFTAFIEKM